MNFNLFETPRISGLSRFRFNFKYKLEKTTNKNNTVFRNALRDRSILFITKQVVVPKAIYKERGHILYEVDLCT